MAEAFARSLAQEQTEIWSAGTLPFGSIIPDTHDTMAERGLSLEAQRSKGLDEVPLAEMDIVVRMGGEVRFALPADFRGRLVDWQISDPYGQDTAFFHRVRDLIEVQVKQLLAETCNR